MRVHSLVIASAVVLSVAGCAFSPRTPLTGFGFSEVAISDSVTSNQIGSKTGTACAESILGIAALGDASVTTAAKNAGITKISTVDTKIKSVLGFWAEVCTVVTGE